MTQYRVTDNPFWVNNGCSNPSDYFEAGQIVDTEGTKPDDLGDYYLRGSAKDPKACHFINEECLEPLEETETETPVGSTQVWSEHLADITRVLKILSDTRKALNEPAAEGVPGHWSDLEFDFPKRVPINLGGQPTGWALEYIEDWDDWGFVINGGEKNNA